MPFRRDVFLFARLSRPFFLLGGLLLFALGALAAHWMGSPIDPVRYIQGQAVVSCLQLVVHFSNEYFDTASDSTNRQRTPFSGGSGALGGGGLPRRTAAWAAAAVGAVGALVVGRMIATGGVPAGSWWVVGASLLGSWFYSAPPVRLVARGLGEITASIVVAVFVPLYAFTLQAHSLHAHLIAPLASLFFLHAAILLVLELPDLESDRSAGKLTLVVRLGVPSTLRVHVSLILLAVGALAAARYGSGVPIPLAFILMAGGAAAWHLRLVQGAAQTGRGWTWATGVGMGLFALTALAEAVGFLRA